MLIRKTESEYPFTLAFRLLEAIVINKSIGTCLCLPAAINLLRRVGLSHTGQWRPDILSTIHQVFERSQENIEKLK